MSEPTWTEEKRKEFEAVAKPLIKWINDNGHPHMSVIITPTSAELVEGSIGIHTTEFVKD